MFSGQSPSGQRGEENEGLIRAIRRVHACDLTRTSTHVHSGSALYPVHITVHFYIMCHHKNTYMHCNASTRPFHPLGPLNKMHEAFASVLRNAENL